MLFEIGVVGKFVMRSPGRQSLPPLPLCRCLPDRTRWREDSVQNQTLHVFIVEQISREKRLRRHFHVGPLPSVTCNVDSEVVPHLASAVHHDQGEEADQRFVNLGEEVLLKV